MNIGEALSKFQVQLQADGRSPHTIKQYMRHIHLFSRWGADNGLSGEVDEVSHEDVARFLSSPIARTGRSGAIKKAISMNSLRTSLKGFFAYLQKTGDVLQDPARLTKRARCSSPPPRSLSKDEIDRFFQAIQYEIDQKSSFASKRDFVLFKLLAETGMRIGSAINLNIEDLDLENQEIWIRSAKGDQPNRIFIPLSIHQVLIDHVNGMGCGPLFTGAKGRRLSQRHVQRRFSIWRDRAKINKAASPHWFRHGFAIRLYNRCLDVLLVKEALCHKSISSTLVYAKVSEDRLRQAFSN